MASRFESAWIVTSRYFRRQKAAAPRSSNGVRRTCCRELSETTNCRPRTEFGDFVDGDGAGAPHLRIVPPLLGDEIFRVRVDQEGDGASRHFGVCLPEAVLGLMPRLSVAHLCFQKLPMRLRDQEAGFGDFANKNMVIGHRKRPR